MYSKFNLGVKQNIALLNLPKFWEKKYYLCNRLSCSAPQLPPPSPTSRMSDDIS